MARILLVAVSLAVLVVVGIVGYRLAQEEPHRFESCRWMGSTLVLGYEYGVNQRVSPSIDPRDGGPIEVALTIESGAGSSPAIALHGVARLMVSGGPTEVRYEDGPEVKCPGAVQRDG
jgi:hypothetical protein